METKEDKRTNFFLKVKGRGLVSLKLTKEQVKTFSDLIKEGQGEFEFLQLELK